MNRVDKSKSGFSLIEVMVATAILMIIVVMIGNIFRQSSSAWETGYSKAEGAMGVRSVLGLIQKELSTAVNGKEFGLNSAVDVTPSKITFYCFKKIAGTGERELHKVTYNISGNEVKRQDILCKPDGSKFKDLPDSTIYSETAAVASKNNSSIKFNFKQASSTSTDSSYVGDDLSWDIPYVVVSATVTRNGSFSAVEARSAGPDGELKTEDDILVR